VAIQLDHPLIDIHTHLMPERLFQAVRTYFRAHLWHPRYDAPIDELVQTLLASGVSRFSRSSSYRFAARTETIPAGLWRRLRDCGGTAWH